MVRNPEREEVLFIPPTTFDPVLRLNEYTSNTKKAEEPKELETEEHPGFTGWTYTPRTESVKIEADSELNKKYRASLLGKDYKSFMAALDKYEKETGDKMSELKKKNLARIAYLESGYGQYKENKNSSAKGWFLFIDETRRNLGYGKNDFLNNANDLFAAASKLYDELDRGYISKYRELAAKKGISDFLLRYAFWWKPKAFIDYLNTGNDTGDDADGTLLRTILIKSASV